MELPELLRNLTFTLVLQDKDVCTDREQESTVSTILRLNLVSPLAFLVNHHNLHCDAGAQDVLIRDSPSRDVVTDVIEERLRKHVMSFLQRLLPTASSHLLNDETIDVEITTSWQSQIGVGSQMLIYFRVPTRDRTPLIPQVATTLVLQLGALMACRADEGWLTGLQWCPLLSLLPGYPDLGDDLLTERCEMERVSWQPPELTSKLPQSPQSTSN
jgi:hypothetical protein